MRRLPSLLLFVVPADFGWLVAGRRLAAVSRARRPGAFDSPTTCRSPGAKRRTSPGRSPCRAWAGRRRRFSASRSGSPRPSTRGTRCGRSAWIARPARSLHDVEVFQLDDPGSIHANNSHASPTPVIEGDRVYVHFGAHGTACLSTDGQIDLENAGAEVQPSARPGRLAGRVEGPADHQLRRHRRAVRRRARQSHRRDPLEARPRSTSAKPAAPASWKCRWPIARRCCSRSTASTQLVSLGSDAVVAHDPGHRRGAVVVHLQRLLERLAAGLCQGHVVFLLGLRHADVLCDQARRRGRRDRNEQGVERDQGGRRAARRLAAGGGRRAVHDQRLGHRRLLRRARPASSTGSSGWGASSGPRRSMPTAGFIASTKRPPPRCWRRARSSKSWPPTSSTGTRRPRRRSSTA